MPVSFFVDPGHRAATATARGVDTITLSYTFYPVTKPKAAARPS